jgi:hypothetical protein
LWQKKNRELVTRTKSSSVWGRGQTSW